MLKAGKREVLIEILWCEGPQHSLLLINASIVQQARTKAVDQCSLSMIPRHGWILRTLPLSGRQGAWGCGAGCWWQPAHSKGLFEGIRFIDPL